MSGFKQVVRAAVAKWLQASAISQIQAGVQYTARALGILERNLGRDVRIVELSILATLAALSWAALYLSPFGKASSF